MPHFMLASDRGTSRQAASRACFGRRKPLPASSPCRCRNMSAPTPGFAAPWASMMPTGKRSSTTRSSASAPSTIRNASSIWRDTCSPTLRVRWGLPLRLCRTGGGPRTRAICSTLIAQAYASIHYPILPERASINGKTYGIAPYVQDEMDHIRTYGLYTPRDFDVSPFFAIVKPTLAAGFDYRTVQWGPPDVAASDLKRAAIVPLI